MNDLKLEPGEADLLRPYVPKETLLEVEKLLKEANKQYDTELTLYRQAKTDYEYAKELERKARIAKKKAKESLKRHSDSYFTVYKAYDEAVNLAWQKARSDRAAHASETKYLLKAETPAHAAFRMRGIVSLIEPVE